jgi:hypothetical protein
MDRRAFLAGGVALATAPGVACADVDDLRTAAREAWLYSLPLIETARLREATLSAGGQVNAFFHQRNPWSPGGLEISAPETGMLYSLAWINLADGPATVRAPPVSGRYQSVTLLTLYGDVLGSLEGEDERAAATLIGPARRVGVPGYTVPEPRLPPIRRMIKSHCPWVWALARTGFSGAADLDGARAAQDGLEVRARAAGRSPAPSVRLEAPWSDYFYAAQQLIDENPPPVDEIGFYRRIALLQLGMAGGFEQARFADADLGAIEQGTAEAKSLASDLHASDDLDGWRYPRSDLGDFGQNFLYRAQVALVEPGAPRPDEVVCLRALTPDGAAVLDSAADYRLSLPGPPPTSGGWSLGLYEVRAHGRLVPTRNMLERYAIGAATPNLRRGPGGEIDIWIGRVDPGANHGANWLPAPASGPFALLLRAYRPDPELIERRWRPPPVEPLRAQPPAPYVAPRIRRHR